VRENPPNGLFGACACLLAGGCWVWQLLARRRCHRRRRRRRRRHSQDFSVGILAKVLSSQAGQGGALQHVFWHRILMRGLLA